MKKLLFLFPSLIFLFSNLLHSQVAPGIEWEKCFGGSEFEKAWSIQQTQDGGYIFAGLASSTDGDVTGNHGEVDYWIVKIDANGNIEWQKCYGGSGQEQAQSIEQTTDGGFIIGGISNSTDGDVSNNHGLFDYWIIRLDQSGNLIWGKSFGGSKNEGVDSNLAWIFGEYPVSVKQTSDGGFIVGGASYSNNGDASGNHGSSDFWILKLDIDGNLVWQKCLGGSEGDYTNSIQQLSDGGYIIAGSTNSNDGDVSSTHGNTDGWIVKLDEDGNKVWEKTYGDTGWDELFSIQETTDHGLVAAGRYYCNFWILRLDSIGNIIWNKSHGLGDCDEAHSVQQTKDGFVLGGRGCPSPNYYNCSFYLIMKYDSAGTFLWEKFMGGSVIDFGFSVDETFDGGYIFGGVAFSEDGDVTGNHSDQGDAWIVKLAGTQSNIFSPKVISLSLSPNPVQDFVNIILATSSNDIAIHVYDLRGRKMNPTFSNYQSQTSNSIQLNTENLPAGFYTLQIISNKTGVGEVGKFVKE